ncbi:MAG: hypothetical protein JSS75_00305 [Bacteroidetes bacterium]|nr:hypothetical protein [Bacteroidota bacterium]
MSLQRIRDIVSTSGNTRSTSVRRGVVNAFFGLYLALFVCDTLNLDVIYASLFGKINFVDDSAISDSLFDVGPSHHESVFAQHHRTNRQLHINAAALHVGDDGVTSHNSVYEDEDSPGVQDASTSAEIASTIYVSHPPTEQRVLTPTISLDRIITFQQILI